MLEGDDYGRVVLKCQNPACGDTFECDTETGWGGANPVRSEDMYCPYCGFDEPGEYVAEADE